MEVDIMKINVEIRKSNLYENNVYIIEIFLSGAFLKDYQQPFNIKYKILNLNKEYAIYKTSLFDKVIEEYGLWFIQRDRSFFKNVYVYYENKKLDFNKGTIDGNLLNIVCKDRDGHTMFNITKKYENVKSLWKVEYLENSNVIKYIEGTSITNLKETIKNTSIEVSSIFNCSEEKGINFFFSNKLRYLYDIVNFFPSSPTNSIVKDKNIIMLVDNIGLKRADIAHELAHVYISKVLNLTNCIYKERIVIEGVCEYISEKYKLEEGYFPLKTRAAIALNTLNIKKIKDLYNILKNDNLDSLSYVLVVYNISPYIIHEVLKYKSIDYILENVKKGNSIIQIVSETFGDVDNYFNTLIQDCINVELDLDVYNEMYGKINMYLYTNVREDINQKDYNDVINNYKLLLDYLNKGRFEEINKLLKCYSI
ncbi:hypothetical protein KPL35_15825 [Clostridium sp. CF011]|uniref:hypothetical protein n=1 Tax=Clostridium sp. CF011 TaxID=2843318 RepID=UPI001C0A9D39|nr:hypothetical protein [Clostridium sp. CF011]MBU3093527.1 hypothetical protein [Clostridium sp. CF011]WAG71736.1 hypothetical protein LL036_18365 [Clostridium sp. CF011]